MSGFLTFVYPKVNKPKLCTVQAFFRAILTGEFRTVLVSLLKVFTLTQLQTGLDHILCVVL